MTLAILVPLAIVSLAAWLRFYRLDLTEYKLDEANLAILAQTLAWGRGFPLVGLGSSVGIPNGPLAGWLMAIPYAVSDSPLAATGFVAAVNVLAIGLTMAITRRMFGNVEAVVAGLLFAVAPWAVIDSRKIWAQDLLPPFVLAYLWTGYLAFIHGKRWALAGHVLALSACIQLHYSGLALAIMTGVWLAGTRRQWTWHNLAPAVVVGLVSVAPFAWGVARGDPVGWARQLLSGKLHLIGPDTEPFWHAWLSSTGLDLHSLAGSAEFRRFLAETAPVWPLFHLQGALALGGIGVAVWRGLGPGGRDERGRAALLVASLLAIPTVFFMVRISPVYPHYFIISFPSQFMLVGLVAGELARRGRRAMLAIVFLVLAVIAAAQIYGYLSIQHFVAAHATPGGYGTPVGMQLRVAQAAAQPGLPVLAYTSGTQIGFDSEPTVWDTLLGRAVPRRFVDPGSARVQPAGRTVMLARVPPGGVGQAGGQIIPFRPGEEAYEVWEWPGQGSDPLSGLSYVRLAHPAVWANQVTLLAYSVGKVAPGQDMTLSTAWQVHGLPPENADYHWTHQLYDAQGKRVWQKDAVGLPASSWRQGDLVLTDYTAPLAAGLAPGAYVMRVGMYTYPDIKTVPVLDEAGNPVESLIQIAVIEVR